jgi:hypothetical protein
MTLEPLIRLPTAWTSVCQRFGVHLFEGRVTVEQMAEMQRIGDRWLAKSHGKLTELVVVFPSDTRMTHEERMRMVQLIKHGEQHRIASATVILADGMLGSLQRSVLTGMMMLVPAPHPAKVFGQVSEAGAWLHPHVLAASGASWKVEELQAVLERHLADFRAR